MSFDAVAFAMGKAGMSRDVVSALMGGGGSGTLEESGWVKELTGNAAVSGNLVDCPTGSSSTRCYIQPPDSIHPSRYFVAGDELQLAIKVIEANARCSYTVDDNSRGTSESATGLFIPSKARGYASQPGTDIVTWTFTGTMKHLYFYPTSGSGGTGSNVSCKFEVTGLKFNGETIFGKV